MPPARLSLLFKHWHQQSHHKIKQFKQHFGISLFCLFLGFVGGNLFGTFLIFFRTYLFWDGFIIMFTILMVELTSYLYYGGVGDQNKDLSNLRGLTFENEGANMLRCFNFCKMGLLLGFFTDAFKVGS